MKLLFFLFTCLLFVRCGDNTDSKNALTSPVSNDTIAQSTSSVQTKQLAMVDKPFSSIHIPFQQFKYDNKKGTRIELPSGTLIDIPKNAFKKIDGELVEEDITIEYREFHTISDIMLSGIKMNTPEGDFESAGMFEIRAMNKSEELDLRKNKEIILDMASYRAGDFNSYQMNEETTEWEKLGTSEVKPNSRKKKRLKNIDLEESLLEEVCEIKPKQYKNGDVVFDLDYDLNRHLELDIFHGAMWLIPDKEEQINFEENRKRYNELEITPKDSCNEYTLTIWNRIDEQKQNNIDKKTFTVIPIWKGNEYKRIKKNFRSKINDYRKKVKEIRDKRRSTEREADLIRSFKLKGMGIYNCDRILNYLKLIPVGIVISCKEKIKNWWYITQNKKVAIKYYNAVDPKFKYNPNSTNSIIAILPNDKTATISDNAFKEAYDRYRKSSPSDKMLELTLEIEGESVSPIETREEFAENILSL